MQRPDPLGRAPFYLEEFFREGLHLACPRCGAHLIGRFGSESIHIPYWDRRMQVGCRQCGFERSYQGWREGVSHRYRMLSPWLRSSSRPAGVRPLPGEARAEFWARTHCLGHELLAANPWHLKALRAYIAPLVRPDCPYGHAAAQDWRERLPLWMKDDDARPAVLQGIERLEQRFAEQERPRHRWLGFI